MNTDEVRELLPWYAAGTLEPDEARAVEEELRRSPQLQHELEQYRALEGIVAEVPAEEPAFRADLLQDAMRRIDAYEQTKAQRAKSNEAEGFFSWLKQTLFGGWGAMPVGVRVALVGQFALVLVLGGALLLPRESSDYGTLAERTEGPRFTVAFKPEATQADMRALLDATQLEIVAGPSAQGNYTLKLTEGADVDSDAALNDLRAATGVVRSATLN